MSVLNFPPSPSTGDLYAFGDYTYRYDGEKWTTLSLGNGRAGQVPTIEALRLLSPIFNGQQVSVGAAVDGPCVFMWSQADHSDDVESDPFSGIYVVPAGADGSSGAWVRSFRGDINLGWFLSTGSQSTTNHERINSALRVGGAMGVGVEWSGDVHIYGDVVIPSYTGLRSTKGGTFRIICHGCSVTTALYGVDGSITPSSAPTIYYKDQPTIISGGVSATITSETISGAKTFSVSSAKDVSVGDHLYITNGYCDMWRAMEQAASPNQWNKDDVLLWQAGIFRVSGVTGNVITVDEPIWFPIKPTPKVYGIFPDENNRADHQGFNVPSFTVLNGSKDSFIEGVTVESDGHGVISTYSENLKVRDCKVIAVASPISTHSCLNPLVESCYSDGGNLGIAFRRATKSGTARNLRGVHRAGDAFLLLMEGSYLCSADDISAKSVSSGSSESICVYINSTHSCSVTNVKSENFLAAVMFGFSYNSQASDVIGTSTDNVFSFYCSRNCHVSSGILTSVRRKSPTIYTTAVVTVSESHNCSASHLTYKSNNATGTKGPAGRAHLFRSTGIKLSYITAPSVALWDSTESDQNNGDQFRATVADCVFYSLRAERSYADVYARKFNFTRCDFINGGHIRHLNNALFVDVNLGRPDLESPGLAMEACWFTRLVRASIRSSTIAIDFKVAGSSGASSYIYLNNCYIWAPTMFKDYTSPEYAFSANNPVSGFALPGEEVSILTKYPLIKTYKNPGGQGSGTGWVVIEQSPAW